MLKGTIPPFFVNVTGEATSNDPKSNKLATEKKQRLLHCERKTRIQNTDNHVSESDFPISARLDVRFDMGLFLAFALFLLGLSSGSRV